MSVRVNYKFWFSGERKAEETFSHHEIYPNVGDTIVYKDKRFVVVERVFDVGVDNDIVHCEEKMSDTLEENF